MTPGVNDDPNPVDRATPDPATGSGKSEHRADGLAGCGPEFLLLEIEIMRLEGVVAQVTDSTEEQG